MSRQIATRAAQLLIICGLSVLGIWVPISPWVQGKFPESREMMADSLADFRELNVALVDLCRYTGVVSVRDVYRPEEFNRVLAWYMTKNAADNFESSVEIYSRSLRALLLYGGGAPTELQGSSDEVNRKVAEVFDQEVIEKAKRLAIVDTVEDYWGRPYRFFLGPWPSDFGPVLFRCYKRSLGRREVPSSLVPSLGVNNTDADRLTILVNGVERGIPAPDLSDLYANNVYEWAPKVKIEAYVWSAGMNGVSDQPIYDQTHSYARPAREYYRSDAPNNYLGGGDDLNNWDIWRSFDVWYLRKSDLKDHE